MIDSRSALVEIHGRAITSPLKVQHKKLSQNAVLAGVFLYAATVYI